MQVPPFKAILMNTMPDNETEVATLAETEEWEDKNVASLAKRLAAFPKNGSSLASHGGAHSWNGPHHLLRRRRRHRVSHRRPFQREARQHQRGL